MRAKIILTVMFAVVIGCSTDQKSADSSVSKADYAPFYTNVDEALAAAKDNQFVVLEFYTDW